MGADTHEVTAVNRFKTNIQRRQDFNSFFQNVFPQAQQYMGPQGATLFMRDAFHEFGFAKAEEYFPNAPTKDSFNMAREAAFRMFTTGEFREPEEGENHAVWLSVFEPTLEELRLLPEGERDPEIIQAFQQHIVRRKAMMQQETQQGQSPQGGGEQPQGLPGEVLANPIEAQEGAIANG